MSTDSSASHSSHLSASAIAFECALKRSKVEPVLRGSVTALISMSAALIVYFLSGNPFIALGTLVLGGVLVAVKSAQLLGLNPAVRLAWNPSLNSNQLLVNNKVLNLEAVWPIGAVLVISGSLPNLERQQLRYLLARDMFTDKAWHALQVWRVWRETK